MHKSRDNIPICPGTEHFKPKKRMPTATVTICFRKIQKYTVHFPALPKDSGTKMKEPIKGLKIRIGGCRWALPLL